MDTEVGPPGALVAVASHPPIHVPDQSADERETEPLINWFKERKMIVTVDGLGHPDEVTARLVGVVDGHRRP